MDTNEEAERQNALVTLMRLIESPAQMLLNADGEPTGIQLFQRGVTDGDMACFRNFTEFESISVGGCSGVTNAGLLHIAHMRKLTFLDLQSTSITDAGLVYLAGLVNLRTLDLNWNRITDLGLCHLEGLRKLKKLVINEDAITREGYDRLLAAIPGLSITNY